MKKCRECGELKDLPMFYKHVNMPDGYLNQCKACTGKRIAKREQELRLNDPNWKEKEKKRHRDKYYRLGYKEKHKPSYESKKETMARYKQKFPEKIQAHYVAMKKVKAKIKGNHLHHWSYNAEHFLDVIELTEQEHNKIHRYMIYDQERKMYRNLDGILLDTKEAHLAHYESIKHLD